MIASLKGNLISKYREQYVVDVAGVGYEVTVCNSVLCQNAELQSEISLIVFTDVRETDISLYGFSEMLEKRVFLLLKKVKGIGSRVAISVLSALSSEELLLAIGQSDVRTLQRVPGIGKKTAERLIVELREQVGELAHSVGGLGASNPLAKLIEKDNLGLDKLSAPEVDAVLALENLGFSRARAAQAVSGTLASLGRDSEAQEIDAGDLLRQALARL